MDKNVNDLWTRRIQKTLPTVYDESLSYYEVLQRVIKSVHETYGYVENIDSHIGEIAETVLNKFLENGSLLQTVVYDSDDESLAFTYTNNIQPQPVVASVGKAKVV